MRRLQAVFALILLAALAGCKSKTEEVTETTQVPAASVAQREDVAALAKEVAAEVATVKVISTGGNGAPIIVLEERHDSPVGQLQQSVVLVRLHERHNLHHICPEGYLKDEPRPEFTSFSKAGGGRDASARIGVAVRLVKEGEISSAEFMKLAYNDVEITPAEVREQYDVSAPKKDAAGAYLSAIALKSLTRESEAAVAAKIQEIEPLPEGAEKEAKKAEVRELIMTAEPWVKQQVDTIQGKAFAGFPIEQQIAFLNGIVDRASAKSATVNDEAVNAMKEEISYLRARAAASETMVKSVVEVADKPDVAVVAMTIGAAHTARVSELLTSMGRAFAVLRPNALDATHKNTDLTEDMFERKRNRRSVYDGGLSQTISTAYPILGRHHPPLVLNEAWFQAKAELYLFADQISAGVLGGGPPQPPGPPGTPPYGFGDDDFKGRRVYIDPRRIKRVPEGNGFVAIFPVELNPDDPALHKTIWVKVGRSQDEGVSKAESSTAEAMLKAALREAAREDSADAESADGKGKAERPARLEDELGRIKISLDSVVVLGRSEAEVEQAAIYRG